MTKNTSQKELKTEVMKKLEDEYHYRNHLIGWIVSDDLAGEGEIRFIKPLAEQFSSDPCCVYLIDLLNDWMLRLQIELDEAEKRSHEHFKKVRKQRKIKQSIDD